ncbi:hypothetical protein GCM10027610_100960 [Dactylosporangium cerinum]
MTAAGSLGKIAHETPTLINEATRLTAASSAILLKCRRRAAAGLRRGWRHAPRQLMDAAPRPEDVLTKPKER